MNSREKGKRGERQWRDEVRAHGYPARRGQQFSGSPESPDVICEGLPWIHFEVKVVERLNLTAAMVQARRDAGGKAAFVAHRRNYWPWLVTMDAERFYRLLRRDLTGEWAARMAAGSPLVACGEFAWLRCEVRTGRRLNIHEAMRQARMDCKAESGKRKAETKSDGHLTPALSPKGGEGEKALAPRVAVVGHQDREGRWLVTVTSETFFKFLCGELPLQGTAPVAQGSNHGKSHKN